MYEDDIQEKCQLILDWMASYAAAGLDYYKTAFQGWVSIWEGWDSCPWQVLKILFFLYAFFGSYFVNPPSIWLPP